MSHLMGKKAILVGNHDFAISFLPNIHFDKVPYNTYILYITYYFPTVFGTT